MYFVEMVRTDALLMQCWVPPKQSQSCLSQVTTKQCHVQNKWLGAQNLAGDSVHRRLSPVLCPPPIQGLPLPTSSLLLYGFSFHPNLDALSMSLLRKSIQYKNDKSHQEDSQEIEFVGKNIVLFDLKEYIIYNNTLFINKIVYFIVHTY